MEQVSISNNQHTDLLMSGVTMSCVFTFYGISLTNIACKSNVFV